jgi:uncharacterized membrane protein
MFLIVRAMDRPASVALDEGMFAITGAPRTLTIVAAVAAAVVGGALFAFSTFVMPALRRMPGTGGMPAMQSINKMAPASPGFMLALMGTAALCVGLAGWFAFTRWGEPGTGWVLAGCALYLLVIVITGVYHIPRNDRLGLLDPAAAGMDGTWRHYISGWQAWNHARTAAAVASSVAFVLGLGASA